MRVVNHVDKKTKRTSIRDFLTKSCLKIALSLIMQFQQSHICILDKMPDFETTQIIQITIWVVEIAISANIPV